MPEIPSLPSMGGATKAKKRGCDKYGVWQRYGNSKEEVGQANWRHIGNRDTYESARNLIPSSRAVLARMGIRYSEYEILCAGEKPL